MWSKGSLALGAVACAHTLFACSDTIADGDGENSAATRQSVINGVTADPPATKQVRIEVVLNQGAERCQFVGSGSLLTNSWILTAAHVIDGQSGNCNVGLLATETSVHFGSQSRDLSKIDARILHPRYRRPGFTDMAMIHVTEPFVVDGSTSGYSRDMSDLGTFAMLGRTTRCFGYGRFAPGGAGQGTLRYGDFVAGIPYDQLTFTIFRDGIVPGSGRIVASSDSGGGCIDSSDPIVGREDIFGIIREVDEGKNPFFAGIQAAPSFRDFARAALTSAAPPYQIDFNGDGLIDATVFVRSIGGFYYFEVQNADETPIGIPFPTLVPATPISNGVVQSFLSLVQGDFNKDGTREVLALGGGLGFLYDSARGAPNLLNLFNGTPPSALLGDFIYATVRDFNEDGFDDVEAVRRDGSSVLLFGSRSGLGPSTPALSRGPDFDGDGLEDTAIAAIGDNIGQTPLPGIIHVVYPDGMENVLRSGDFSAPPQTGTDAREVLGLSMAWGNFDADPADEFVAYLRNPLGLVYFDYYDQKRFIPASELGVPPTSNNTRFGVGVYLVSGDVDGDGSDDLLFSRGDVPGVRVLFGRLSGGFDSASRSQQLAASDVALSSLRGLTVGDFNCDGRADVAMSDDDKLSVVNGSDTGMQLGTLKSFSVSTGHDRDFDQAMVAGNFNGDTSGKFPCVDLAVGAGREVVDGQPLGVVHVLYGGANGLTETGRQKLSPCCFGPGLGPFPQFGASLAMSRLNDDPFDDLMVGWELANQATGAVFAYAGSSTGIRESSRQIWQSDSPHDIDSFGAGLGGTTAGYVTIGSPFAETSPQLGNIQMIQPNNDLTIAKRVKRAADGFSTGNVQSPMTLLGYTISAPRPGTTPRVHARRVGIPPGLLGIDVTPRVAFATFDDPLRQWTSSVPLRPDFQNKTQGQSSLVVDGSGKITLESPPFSTTEFAVVGTQISVDVFIPADKHDPTQPNKIEMSFSAPSAGIPSVTFGTQMHVDWKQGQWNTVNFAVPDNVVNALRGEFSDAQYAFSFHTSKKVSPLAFDNLRFTGGIQRR